jgi:hypothetical protein
MTQTIRFRMPHRDAGEWEDMFKAALHDDDVASNVHITRPVISAGLPAVDPTIVVAAISGGASVLAALITAFATIWVKRDVTKQQATEPSNLPVAIVIAGSKDSVELPLQMAADRIVLANALEAAAGRIGVVREVSIERP